MPSLAGVDSVDASKPLAVVFGDFDFAGWNTVAGGGLSSLWQRAGGGCRRGGMWRWAFLPPQYQDQEQIYASLWPQYDAMADFGENLKPGRSLIFARIRFVLARMSRRRDTAGARGKWRRAYATVELMKNDSAVVAKTFTPSPMGAEAGVFSRELWAAG